MAGGRLSGVLTDLRGLGPHDHVCWSFDDRATFLADATSFLAEGLELGERVWYVGSRDDGVQDALPSAAGAVQVVPLDSTYAADAVVDPMAQVRSYAAATEQALADGFTGLRVATDATPLVATVAQLDAFARYEHLVDRYMTGRPFSAMCAYNRAELDAGALLQLASLHPVARHDDSPFRLHASTVPGCAATISGELDLATASALALALERAEPRPEHGVLRLDAAGLTFVDHTRLGDLVDHARRFGAILVLRTDQPVVRRLVDVLRLDGVRIEGAS